MRQDLHASPSTRSPRNSFCLSVAAVPKYNAFVVTGQPGFFRVLLRHRRVLRDLSLREKSVSLLRLFSRRLELRSPTALHIDPDRALIFCEGVYRARKKSDLRPVGV